jgi:hypothetical protein
MDSLGHDSEMHFLETLVSSRAVLTKAHIFSRTKLGMKPIHFIVPLCVV